MPRADLRRTGRAQVAASTAESEARHRALLAALPEGVVLHDRDGSFLLANPAARELLRLADPVPPRTSGGSSRKTMPSQRAASDRSESHSAAGYSENRASRLVADVASRAVATGQVQYDIDLVLDRDAQPTRLRVTAVPLISGNEPPQAAVTTFTAVETARPLPRTGESEPGGFVSLAGPDDELIQQLLAAGRLEPDQAANRPLAQNPPPASPPVPIQGADLAAGPGQDMFRLSMQHSPIGVAVASLNGRFLRVNRELCRMLGYRADQLQERTLYEIIHPADLEETSIQIGQLIRGDLDVVALDRRYVGHGGMQLWGQLSITVVRDQGGSPQQFVVQVEDASEIHQAQQLLTHMTLHDTLTGLPNRTLVLDRIQKALDRSQRSRRQVAVLLCDVDHFRVINDSAGHEQGDAVLIELGRRLGGALKPGDTAGRLGADEFVVVCEDVASEHEAVVVAERIQSAVTKPLEVADRDLLPTVSIGIAVNGGDADPTSMLRDAGIARYRAKDRGRNRWDLVDAGLRQRAVERLDLEHALRAGLEMGDLRLHFQPIVDLTSRRLLGREALLRWEHPEHGLLAPLRFLPMAEESGLISQIGHWVLTEAVRAAAASPESAGYVSVNVSPRQVAQPGLAQQVEKVLGSAGLPPERLMVELTESVVLSAAPSARRELELLDRQGVRVMVDDFGTGFSALSYLRDLPVSGIKVDRSFTAGLGTDAQCERIVEALTGLGHGLGVDVIVEGVETEEQSALLADLGVRHAQGYLFGRPGPEFTPELV